MRLPDSTLPDLARSMPRLQEVENRKEKRYKMAWTVGGLVRIVEEIVDGPQVGDPQREQHHWTWATRRMVTYHPKWTPKSVHHELDGKMR